MEFLRYVRKRYAASSIARVLNWGWVGSIPSRDIETKLWGYGTGSLNIYNKIETRFSAFVMK